MQSQQLHFACANSQLSDVQYLISECNGDPHCKREDGSTPLHDACENTPDVVEYLVSTCNCDPCCADSKGYTPLHVACEKGHLNIVRELFNSPRCNPQVRNCEENTPLHLACLEGHLDIVQDLVEYNTCDPWDRAFKGRTSLHIACEFGRFDVAKYLIKEQGCDPSDTDKDGNTSFYWACYGGNLELVEELYKNLKFQCDPMCKNNPISESNMATVAEEELHIMKEPSYDITRCSSTPLHIAAYCGHSQIVQFLVTQAECSPSCTNDVGYTPLHFACLQGCLHVAEFLLDKKCDPNCASNNGTTPLHCACWTGQKEIVQYLITECNCSQKCTNRGFTPLHSGCLGGNLSVVRYLIEDKNNDPKSCRSDVGLTPLHLACQNGHLEVSDYLIKKWKCDPSCVSSNNSTPLHLACRNGNLQLVKYLLERQCDIDCKTSSKQTPLHVACRHECYLVVQHLIESGCNPNSSDNKGWTPLHIVCQQGNLEILQCLCKHPECDITCKNEKGQTPLHLACQQNQVGIVEYLVTERNCSPNCSDNEGCTPLHEAAKAGRLEIAECLCKHPECDITCKNEKGQTPLDLAYQKRHQNVINYLTAQTSYTQRVRNALKCTVRKYPTWIFTLALMVFFIAMIRALSYLDAASVVCRRAQNNLPKVREPVFGRETETAVLVEKLKSEEVRIMNIYGQTASGKSTLAVSLGYEMAMLGMTVYYINFKETPLHDDQVVFSTTTDLVLILDRCDKSQFNMLNSLLYKLRKFDKLRIILTTHEKFSIPHHQIHSKAFHFEIRKLLLNRLMFAIYHFRYYLRISQTAQEDVEVTKNLPFSMVCGFTRRPGYLTHLLSYLHDRVCYCEGNVVEKGILVMDQLYRWMKAE